MDARLEMDFGNGHSAVTVSEVVVSACSGVVVPGGSGGRFVFQGGGAGWFWWAVRGTGFPCVPEKKTKKKNTDVECHIRLWGFGCRELCVSVAALDSKYQQKIDRKYYQSSSTTLSFGQSIINNTIIRKF
jgi:hypothetical protein